MILVAGDFREGHMAITDLRTLAQRRADAEQRLARAETALREARRRDDSRRKIVLGGAVLAAVRAGDIRPEEARALVARYVSERDHPLFISTALEVRAVTEESVTPETSF